MKKTHFTEAQIMAVLRQMEDGVPAAELCREHGMGSATLYKWRAKYGGMDASLINEMKAMVEGEPFSAIDSVDGPTKRHRDVPKWG